MQRYISRAYYNLYMLVWGHLIYFYDMLMGDRLAEIEIDTLLLANYLPMAAFLMIDAICRDTIYS